MVFIKKSTLFRHKRYYARLRRILYSNNICDTSFCDAIANIYDKMVLKISINTIAKPHV